MTDEASSDHVSRVVPSMTVPELRRLAQQARRLASMLSEGERDWLVRKAERIEAEADELEHEED